MNRRDFMIRSIGAAIIAGGAPTFLASLLPEAPQGVTSGSAIAELSKQSANRETYTVTLAEHGGFIWENAVTSYGIYAMRGAERIVDVHIVDKVNNTATLRQVPCDSKGIVNIII